jgi:hypothetical protein
LGSDPTNPKIAILECIIGGASGQKGHRRRVNRDDLEEKIADGPRGAQIEERIQLGIELSFAFLGRCQANGVRLRKFNLMKICAGASSRINGAQRGNVGVQK